MSRARFSVPPTPGAERRRLLGERRVRQAAELVERARSRSTVFRRLACALGGHAWVATGLAGQARDGSTYSLHVCSRCGRRAAGEVRP